jgi:hypothetical protein
MIVLKVNSASKTKSKDNQIVEILDKELKDLVLKMISDLKEDSNKQINEVRKSIQNLDEKIPNRDEKFSKEIEIWRKKET